jgi:hypothetical protein
VIPGHPGVVLGHPAGIPGHPGVILLLGNTVGMLGHPGVILRHTDGQPGYPGVIVDNHACNATKSFWGENLLTEGILGHPGGTRPGGELSRPMEILGPT